MTRQYRFRRWLVSTRLCLSFTLTISCRLIAEQSLSIHDYAALSNHWCRGEQNFSTQYATCSASFEDGIAKQLRQRSYLHRSSIANNSNARRKHTTFESTSSVSFGNIGWGQRARVVYCVCTQEVTKLKIRSFLPSRAIFQMRVKRMRMIQERTDKISFDH